VKHLSQALDFNILSSRIPDERHGFHVQQKLNNLDIFAIEIRQFVNEVQMREALTRCMHKQQDHT